MLPKVVGAKAGNKGRRGRAEERRSGRNRFALILFAVVFAGLFVVFAVAEGIGGPSIPSGDILVVQDVPSQIGQVSEDRYQRAFDQLAAQEGQKKAPKPGSEKYEEMKENAMNGILDQIWIQGEAEEQGITVTEKEVAEELAQIKKQNFPAPGAYQKFLKESHLNQAEVNERVRLQVTTKRLEEFVSGQAPTPSKSEIEQYYEEEKSTQFTSPASRDVRVIVNEDKSKVEAAKAALDKDNSPASWKKVARKYSADPSTKTKGGLQPKITEEFVRGPLRKAIFGSPTGVVVGPVKFEKSYVVTEVVKLNPEEVKTLPEVQAQIKSSLTTEKQQAFSSEFIGAYQTRWRSRTYCASGFVIARCANYKGNGHPAGANPACYEANPKTPAKECPSPVAPISPALPGTVTLRKPKGEPFPQRPIPESSGSEASSELPATAAPPAK